MGGLVEAVFGDGETQTSSSTYAAPPTEQENALISLNTELAKKQLANLDQLAPFQQELVTQSLAELKRQGAISQAIDGAVTPEQRAALAKQDYDRSVRMGPLQEQLLQRQMDAMQGKISPEMEANLSKAADSAIASGSSDIDTATQRGIGLISDEVANARGLRLTDSPIMREAAMLSRAGQDQKLSLEKSVRSNQMNLRLGLPAQVSGIGMGQQQIADAASNFQAELGQRAQMNRQALFGQTSSSGIGMANTGSGVGSSTLGSLTSVRGKNFSGSGFDPSATISSYGKLFQGLGSMMAG